MWPLFLVDVAFAAAILLIPGFFFFRAARFARLDALVLSPACTLLIYYVLAYAYLFLDFRTSWAHYFFPSLLLGLLVWFIICRRRSFTLTERSMMVRPIPLCLFLTISIVICFLFFVLPLDSAESFFQENDNIAHLSGIRDSLNSGLYVENPPFFSYPYLWNLLTSLVAGFGQNNVAVAVNATNFLIIALVFPSAMCLLMSRLFGGDSRIVYVGSLFAVSFAAFPWGFLTFGPLYPNLLGYSLLPLAAVEFSLLLGAASIKSAVIRGALFLSGCLLLMAAHPNAVFSGIAILAPYGAAVLYRRSEEWGLKGPRQLLAPGALCLLVAAVWYVLYQSPVFAGVVNFDWPAYTTTEQAISNLFQLALTKANAPQIILSGLVLLGVVASVLKRKYCWLTASLLVVSVIYVLDVSGTDFRTLFSGFWYNDSFRVAAMLPFVGISLASIGFDAILSCLESAVARGCQPRDLAWSKACLVLMGSATFLVANYYPSFDIPQNGLRVVTAFDMVESMLREQNSLREDQQGFDSEEGVFIEKVKDVVGDSPVINYPYDGSAYAYALYDLNVVNRTWFYDGEEDLSDIDSQLLRKHIDEIALSQSAQSSAKRKGVEYLMLLDSDGMENGEGCFYTPGYVEGDWTGIESVNDSTPGLEIVLAEGDMRLYKIVV